jgi:phosphoribosylformylglycinamidine synthase
MWQFSEAVDGIAEACRALAIPITGGNVSFYNDTLGKSIDPTPVLGILGLLEDASRAMTMGFRAEGDIILLLDGRGDAAPGGAGTDALPAALPDAPPATNKDSSLHEFASSEYARTIAGVTGGTPPAIDLPAEARLIEALIALASAASLTSAHDLSDGGLAVALAECGFASEGLAADVSTEGADPAELALFGEAGARAVVTAPESLLAQVRAHAAKYGVAARPIGRVTRAAFQIRYNGVTVIRDAPPALRAIWTSALQRALAGQAPGRTPLANADLARSVLGENASN